MASLMDMQQGPMPQQEQGQVQGGPPQGGQLFPANKEELVKLKEAVIGMIHDEQITDSILEQVVNSETLEEGVAQMSAMVMMKVIVTISGKTGRDINIQAVAVALREVNREIFKLMGAAGIIKEMPDKRMQATVLQLSKQMLEQLLVSQIEQQEQGMQGQEAGGEAQQDPSLMGQGAPQEVQGV